MTLAKRLSSWLFVSLIGAAVFLTDFYTKKLTVDCLSLRHNSIELFKGMFGGIDLSLTYATNSGAAWGAFGEYPKLLISFRILLVAALASFLFFGNSSPKFRLPLMFILSGAIGNISDYFIYGHVVDMIHFVFYGYDYPVFNVADSFIFIGTFSILFLLLFEKQRE